MGGLMDGLIDSRNQNPNSAFVECIRKGNSLLLSTNWLGNLAHD